MNKIFLCFCLNTIAQQMEEHSERQNYVNELQYLQVDVTVCREQISRIIEDQTCQNY